MGAIRGGAIVGLYRSESRISVKTEASTKSPEKSQKNVGKNRWDFFFATFWMISC